MFRRFFPGNMLVVDCAYGNQKEAGKVEEAVEEKGADEEDAEEADPDFQKDISGEEGSLENGGRENKDGCQEENRTQKGSRTQTEK